MKSHKDRTTTNTSGTKKIHMKITPQRKLYTLTTPLKIIIYADGERFTDNSIQDAMKTIKALLTEGTQNIEITNVSEQIARTNALQAGL